MTRERFLQWGNSFHHCSIGNEGAACSPLAPTLSTCLLSGGYGGLPVVPGIPPHWFSSPNHTSPLFHFSIFWLLNKEIPNFQCHKQNNLFLIFYDFIYCTNTCIVKNIMLPKTSSCVKALAIPLLKKIIPDLGPLRVLCVVVVTMSQYSKGLGATPVATSPLTWAISASTYAPFSSAISLNRL